MLAVFAGKKSFDANGIIFFRERGNTMVYTIFNLVGTLLINLIHTDVIVKRQYSIIKTILVLALFTFILFGFLYIIGLREQTTIRSVLVGSLYIIPLYYLYKTNLKKIFIVMVYCWTYTIFANTFTHSNHLFVCIVYK